MRDPMKVGASAVMVFFCSYSGSTCVCVGGGEVKHGEPL